MTTRTTTIKGNFPSDLDWITTFNDLLELNVNNAAIGLFADTLENLRMNRQCVLKGGADVDCEFWSQMAGSMMMDADRVILPSGEAHPVSIGVRAKLDEVLSRERLDRKYWVSQFADFLRASR